MPRPVADQPSASTSGWCKRYGDRYRPKKIMIPGSPDGRVGRVTLYERNGSVQLSWRENKKPGYDLSRAAEYENPLAEALRRAAEINARLEEKRPSGRGYRRSTIPEACAAFLKSKESSPKCSAGSIEKYREELARVIEFAESTPEGRRARYLHQVDSDWCESLNGWLDNLRTTKNGRKPTERNPLKPYSEKQKHGIRSRLRSLIEFAMFRDPPLVPRDFRNPMSRDLVGSAKQIEGDISDPPVNEDELVSIVSVLDAYSLGLLAPLFLYGPRPSELGRILRCDYDEERALLRVKCRPQTYYWTKGKRHKVLPVDPALAECLRPFAERGPGPLLVKRWVFEGKAIPVLAGADEAVLAREFEERSQRLRAERGENLTKKELKRISISIWTDAGAVSDADVRGELTRAAARAGLRRTPTPKDVRHLFESTCEGSMLAEGVIRLLMGHAPKKGDNLPSYNHTSAEVLREQVELLNRRRRRLIDALLRRAAEIGRRPAAE